MICLPIQLVLLYVDMLLPGSFIGLLMNTTDLLSHGPRCAHTCNAQFAEIIRVLIYNADQAWHTCNAHFAEIICVLIYNADQAC